MRGTKRSRNDDDAEDDDERQEDRRTPSKRSGKVGKGFKCIHCGSTAKPQSMVDPDNSANRSLMMVLIVITAISCCTLSPVLILVAEHSVRRAAWPEISGWLAARIVFVGLVWS